MYFGKVIATGAALAASFVPAQGELVAFNTALFAAGLPNGKIDAQLLVKNPYNLPEEAISRQGNALFNNIMANMEQEVSRRITQNGLPDTAQNRKAFFSDVSKEPPMNYYTGHGERVLGVDLSSYPGLFDIMKGPLDADVIASEIKTNRAKIGKYIKETDKEYFDRNTWVFIDVPDGNVKS
jgi:hypothetical protein